MESIRKRKRKIFAPLSTSVTIACDSAFSPVTQVYDSITQEYQPDREVIYTVLRPVVTANASDGSWTESAVNALLSDMHWYANGVDISTLSSWTGKYEIAQSGLTRGSLIIRRNVATSERIDLQFRAVLPDSRLGLNVPIVSGYICLHTTDKSTDSYSCSLSEDAHITYRPLLDKLFLYRYKVNEGLIVANEDTEDDARDGNEYEHTLHYHLYLGGQQLNSGYTVKLYHKDTASSSTEVTASDPRIISLSVSSLTLDLRLVSKDDYILKFYVDGDDVASLQFSCSLEYFPIENPEPVDECDIQPTSLQIANRLTAQSDGCTIDCPGAYLDITWYTDSAYKTATEHNCGEDTLIDLSRTGIGSNHNDDWLDVYAACSQKGPYNVAVDGDGDVLTDSEGNPYIFR